jgi:hypothetical protein
MLLRIATVTYIQLYPQDELVAKQPVVIEEKCSLTCISVSYSQGVSWLYLDEEGQLEM